MGSVNPLGPLVTPATQSGSGVERQDPLDDLGRNEFLKLLVVQLEHQDPLSPLKNENFIAQLATFSSLEQLVSINDAVTTLANTDTESQSLNPINLETILNEQRGNTA